MVSLPVRNIMLINVLNFYFYVRKKILNNKIFMMTNAWILLSFIIHIHILVKMQKNKYGFMACRKL